MCLPIIVATMAFAAAPASAGITHKFQAQITETEPFEPFGQPWGLALNAGGNLFVADAVGSATGEAIDVFNSSNVFVPPALNDASVAPATPFTGPFVRSVAVDNLPGSDQGMVYVAEANNEFVDVFKPEGAGKYALVQERKFSGFMYVAFDNSSGPNSGDVYVMAGKTGEQTVHVIKPNGSGELEEAGVELPAPPGGFTLGFTLGNADGSPGAGGLAVGPTGKVYLANPGAGAVDVYTPEGTSPTVLTAGPHDIGFEPIAVGVDPSNGNVYAVDGSNHVVDEFNSKGQYLTQITAGKVGEPLVSPLDVTVNAAGEVYVSDGEAKAVDVYGADEEEFIAPSVSGETTSGLTVDEATLEANIDPNGLAASFATTYHFEYGTSNSYTTLLPDAQLPPGTNAVTVSTHLSGLSPNTLYHWRVVATNAAGTTTGADHTFIYPTTGKPSLPDGRAYEMVTPTHKNGALLGTVFDGLQPAIAEDGSRIIISTLQCFEEGSCPAKRTAIGTSYAFTRTPSGWQASSLAPPATQYATNSVWTVNAEEGTGLFSMPTGAGGEDEFYAGRPGGGLTRIGPVTAPALGALSSIGDGGQAKHATSDFSHLVYPELGPQWPFDETAIEHYALYEYAGVAVQPMLVGVSGGRGSNDLVSKCGTMLGNQNPSGAADNEALSNDGRFVYFTALNCAEGGSGLNAGVEVPANELYARINDEESVQISSRASPQDCSGACAVAPPGDAMFQGASADGTKAYFTDTHQLTNLAGEDNMPQDSAETCSATVGANGCNLYLYDFGRPAGKRLVTVSAGDSSGGGPRVQGVLAVAQSGQRVYFVAKGVLTRSTNSRGEVAVDGAENMYVWGAGEGSLGGVVRFVTRLSALNSTQPGGDASEWADGGCCANATADGRFVVFTSQRPLTGDDSRREGGAAQVFRYDATSGELVRITTGEGGFDDGGNAGVGDASIVAADAFQVFAGSGTRNPTMTNDAGEVFFMSPVGLTAQALNDVAIGKTSTGAVAFALNVYEWRDGHVYLLSDGRDVGVEPVTACASSGLALSASCLVGVSGSGRDVFLTSSDQLVPADTDTQLDFYDARVCEPERGDPCVSGSGGELPSCVGEACHGSPAATPSAPAPGSAVFSGRGNQGKVLSSPPAGKKCKRGFMRKRGRCVKARRRAKHSKKRPRKQRRNAAHRGHASISDGHGVRRGVA